MLWILKAFCIIAYYSIESNASPLRSQYLYHKRRNPAAHSSSTSQLATTDLTSPPVQYHRRNVVLGRPTQSSLHRGIDKTRSLSNIPDKTSKKRGVNVGIELNIPKPTQRYESDLEKLEDMLAKALSDRIEGVAENTSGCPSCDEEEAPVKILKPAYECDEWDPQRRICILERNIGDTVTFYLSVGKHEGKRRLNVTWKKEFHLFDSASMKQFIIDPENTPENIIIGRKGFELRISPITETDLEYNMFSASLKSEYPSTSQKVYFMIRVVPIDMGFVYVGETIELNTRSHISLPAQSIRFKWYMEKDGEHGTLPSNMKVSSTGSSIKISELRQEQEGSLACSMYTNLNILATKMRFLLKDLVKNNDILKSSPNHTLVFKESKTFREKRDPELSLPMLASRILKRSKREEDLDAEIESALEETTVTEKHLQTFTTIKPSYDYAEDLRMAGEEQPANQRVEDEFSDSVDSGAESPNQVDISIDALPPYQNGQQRPSKQYDSRKESRFRLQGETKGASSYDLPERPFSNNKEPEEYVPINRGPPPKVFPPKNNHGSAKQPSRNKVPSDFVDINIETKKDSHPKKNYQSDIILNLDRIPKPRTMTAEEKIAKIISFCFSDFECAESAMCVRPDLKTHGHCKCLPGTFGVGIFCREATWQGNNDIDLEEENDVDVMANSSPPE